MAEKLSESQAAALFDILTHYDTYAEIRDFRNPTALQAYGPPFAAQHKKLSTSPALQTLVSRFLLVLPGLKDLPDDFWKVHCHDIIQALEDADLSESYDKGVMGSRKTLATAISALFEYPVRGTYGGFAQIQQRNPEYNVHDAEDLSRAFRDFLDQAIYGTILEDTVDRAAKSDQLADHEPLIQAVHEFMLVNLASFMHYTLILSPKGQYLVKLMDNINKLVPYIMVRQTLKIGNVASMINAMVKIGLAKMSIASMTNWIGLTKTEDEGMNLMQQIISTVLNWDNKDLETRAYKIEKDKNGPSKEQLNALKDYIGKSREDHNHIRKQSQKESISIVTSILQSAGQPVDLGESQHKQALEYLSVNLSIRDRKEIVRIFCHSSPDHLTTTVRSLVTAYEPVIRQMHKAIDLADTVYDAETFLKDMLKLSKVQPSGKDGKSAVPTVGDFVQLLKKHQFSCHKFIHQCCKNGTEVTSWYLEWAKTAAGQFKRGDESQKGSGAGNMTKAIGKLFDDIPEKTQEQIIPILDAHTKYLDETHEASLNRLKAVIRCAPSKNPVIAKIFQNSSGRPGSRQSSRPSSRAPSPTGDKKVDGHPPSETSNFPPPAIDSDPGPGAYLARWQDLLESTPITPLTAKGVVRQATSEEVVARSAVDVNGEKMADYPNGKSGAEKVSDQPDREGQKVKKPDVRVVIEALGENFRHLLAEESVYW